MFFGAILVVIGYLVIIFSGGILGGIYGRVIAGIGSGCNTFALPLWLLEVSMSELKKITIAIFNLMNGSGMLVGLNLCIPFRHHWKWLYIGGFIPIGLLILFWIFMSESPVYLLVNERDDEVLEALKKGLDEKDAYT